MAGSRLFIPNSTAKSYYKRYAPHQWEEIKEVSAILQIFLLSRLKAGETLR